MRIRAITFCLLLISSVCSTALATPPVNPPHDREFWRAVVKSKFAVPTGESVFPLIQELSSNLGSSDPEVRDDLAYTIIDQWIRHQELSAEQLNSLADGWRGNLRAGIGESGTDSVFKRSFSALCLASLARRELKTPFLGAERFQQLLQSALAELHDERDLRGFDPQKGWIHATAHTADLLTYLAANPLLKAQEQEVLLKAISERLSSAHEIFTYGEQGRLALIAGVIATRTDFDSAGFDRWLADLNSDQKVWDASPPRLGLLQTFENNTYMLQALAAGLASEPSGSPAATARDSVVKLLQRR
jgi:hypothetical protein